MELTEDKIEEKNSEVKRQKQKQSKMKHTNKKSQKTKNRVLRTTPSLIQCDKSSTYVVMVEWTEIMFEEVISQIQ